MSAAAAAAPAYTTLTEPVATPYTMPTVTTGPVTYSAPMTYEPQQTTYGVPQVASTVAPAVTYAAPATYAAPTYTTAPTYSVAAPVYETPAVTYEAPAVYNQTTYGLSQPVTYEAAAAPVYSTIAAPVTYEAPVAYAPPQTTYGLPGASIEAAAPMAYAAPMVTTGAPVYVDAPQVTYEAAAPVTYSTYSAAAPVTYSASAPVEAAPVTYSMPAVMEPLPQAQSMIAYQPQQGSYVVSAPQPALVEVTEEVKTTETTAPAKAAVKVTKKKKASKKKVCGCCGQGHQEEEGLQEEGLRLLLSNGLVPRWKRGIFHRSRFLQSRLHNDAWLHSDRFAPWIVRIPDQFGASACVWLPFCSGRSPQLFQVKPYARTFVNNA